MRSAAALFLAAAAPAAAEIHLDGGGDFGLEAFQAEDCLRNSITFRQACTEIPAGAPAAEQEFLKIGADAKMGFAYDGSRIRPVSGVSITISVGSETDSGLRFGGTTTVESE